MISAERLRKGCNVSYFSLLFRSCLSFKIRYSQRYGDARSVDSPERDSFQKIPDPLIGWNSDGVWRVVAHGSMSVVPLHAPIWSDEELACSGCHMRCGCMLFSAVSLIAYYTRCAADGRDARGDKNNFGSNDSHYAVLYIAPFRQEGTKMFSYVTWRLNTCAVAQRYARQVQKACMFPLTMLASTSMLSWGEIAGAAALGKSSAYRAGSVSSNSSLDGVPLICLALINLMSLLSTELSSCLGGETAPIAAISAAHMTMPAAILLVRLV
jgi:hypothetical protein